jgi:hypothetical protein
MNLPIDASNGREGSGYRRQVRPLRELALGCHAGLRRGLIRNGIRREIVPESVERAVWSRKRGREGLSKVQLFQFFVI